MRLCEAKRVGATAVLHHWEEQNLPRDPIPGARDNNAVLPRFGNASCIEVKEGNCTQATRSQLFKKSEA